MRITRFRGVLSVGAVLLGGLILAVMTVPGSAREIELVPASGQPAVLDAGSSWALLGEGMEHAPALAFTHVLQPTVREEDGTVLTVRLPNGGSAQFSPLGIYGETRFAARGLRRGDSRLLAPTEGAHELRVEDAWAGVDERFLLLETGVKHDLILEESAVAALRGGDVTASWLVELSPDVRVSHEGRAGAVFRDAEGSFLARVPLPMVADGDDAHPTPMHARLELEPMGADAAVLNVIVRGTWLHSAERAFPIYIDPTVESQPLDNSRTGFVDERGSRLNGPIVSGSLFDIGFGMDCRGFAEFDLSAIPDGATIDDLILRVWTANHDNPGDPAQPTLFEVHQTLEPSSASTTDIWNAIGPLGGGVSYFTDILPGTGTDYCPDAFGERFYDLGAQGRADLEAQLASDWFTLGFVSDVAPNPAFNHLDYQGYPETVAGIGCSSTTLPGSRITLLVSFGVSCTPRNHGYWYRYCLGSGTIDPGRNGGGNGPGPKLEHMGLPAGLLAEADANMAAYGMTACEALDDGPFSDRHLAALRELATAYLNMAAGKLTRGCDVELHPIDDTPGLTVGDAIDMMIDRIADGSDRALKEARWIGEHVVNREALIREKR